MKEEEPRVEAGQDPLDPYIPEFWVRGPMIDGFSKLAEAFKREGIWPTPDSLYEEGKIFETEEELQEAQDAFREKAWPYLEKRRKLLLGLMKEYGDGLKALGVGGECTPYDFLTSVKQRNEAIEDDSLKSVFEGKEPRFYRAIVQQLLGVVFNIATKEAQGVAAKAGLEAERVRLDTFVIRVGLRPGLQGAYDEETLRKGGLF